MPRARNLKPGFFANEELAACTVHARLCFAGLWTLADRKGRLEDKPLRIKGELFRFDSFPVEPLLEELERGGFIVRYQADGQRVIEVLAFSKHQSPHYLEKASVLPPRPPTSPGRRGRPTPQEPETPPPSSGPKSETEPPIDAAESPGQDASSSGAQPETDTGIVDEKASDKTWALVPIIGGRKPPDILNPDILNPDSGSLIPDSGSPPPDGGRTAHARASPAAGPPIAPSRAGAAGRALIAGGLQPTEVQTSSPSLLRLLEAGVTDDQLTDAARTACAAAPPKGFSYALAVAAGRLRDAACMAVPPARASPQAKASRLAQTRQLLGIPDPSDGDTIDA